VFVKVLAILHLSKSYSHLSQLSEYHLKAQILFDLQSNVIETYDFPSMRADSKNTREWRIN